MLPGRDGIEVLAAVRRARPALPVIMLTASAEVADRVEGLESGATDYVTKPFAFDELLARIRARLREGDGGVGNDDRGRRGSGSTCSRREVTRDGESVGLPEREADLLAHLMRHVGRVCSREELLSAVWGYDHDPGTNVVQVYVGYLRRKLEPTRLAGADRDRARGRLPAAGARMRTRLVAPRAARAADDLDRRDRRPRLRPRLRRGPRADVARVER